MERQKKSTIKDYRNWVLVLISITVTLLLVELTLQLVDKINPNILSIEKQSTEFLSNNKYWKKWHYPSNQVTHSYQCIDAEYSTNEYGLRDKKIDFSKQKIALIGDSYVEGYGVSDQNTIPSRLESHFDNQIEVLNFGISGGIGNVHTASLYENFAVHFEPDMVVIFFLSYNDLYDNVLALKEGFLNQNFELDYPVSDSLEVFGEVLSKKKPPIINNLTSNILLPYLIKRGIGNLISMLQIILNVKFEFSEIIGLPFYPDEPEIIEQGYLVLENSLAHLQSLQAPNLVLVNLPTPFQVDENWKKTFELTNQVELEIFKPNQKLKEISNRLNIPLFDPIEQALEYIDSTNMSYPYLYNVCDKHFNEKGYALMSEWLADWLVTSEYVIKDIESNYLLIHEDDATGN